MGPRFLLVVITGLLILKSELLFAQMNDPLTNWTFRDSTFYYVSGLMDLTSSADSLTIFLTNQDISCSNVPIPSNGKDGAWIEVEFPDFTIKNYSLGEIWGTMSCYIFGSYWQSYTGYLGSAGITSIDTIEKRVYGWVDFEPLAFDVPLAASGNFNVQYCSEIVISLPENIYNNLFNSFELFQNYPNPFNPVTKISYQLAKTSYAELSIYNLFGQRVAILVRKKQSAGKYIVQWDASGFTSGVYFYRLMTNKGFSDSRKLILLK